MSKNRATDPVKKPLKGPKKSNRSTARGKTKKSSGALGIIRPNAGTIPVKDQHYICADGSYPGSDLSRIFGRVGDANYNPGPTPEPPYTEGTVIDSYGSNWWFHGDQLISGAICSGQPPYPVNKLVVWGSLSGNSGSYVREILQFSGSCAGSTQCDPSPEPQQVLPVSEHWPVRLIAAVSDKHGDFEDMADELEFHWDAARQRWLAFDSTPERGRYTLYLSQCGPASGYLLANPLLHPALVSPAPKSHYSPLHLIFEIAGADRIGIRGGCTLTIVVPNSR
jgi:hypothetical protein